MRTASKVLALALASAAAAHADEPREWLSRMNEALTTRNYDGQFFHVHDGRIETMRIIHRVNGREVTERLVSLDGSGREFVRRGSELTCYLPDKRTVLVERRKTEGPLLGALPALDAANASMYKIDGGAERTRLMGRNARLVSIGARDDFRYGYRLWIDEDTAMPLKTQLCDERGRVLEQIVFSSLSLPAEIPDSAFVPAVDATGFRWLRDDGGSLAARGAPVLWEALRLPPGFRLSIQGMQAMPGSKEGVSHMVFTDGIASVSVFVEPRASGTPLQGPSRLGSSSAFSTVIDGHQVTAVGEVPPNTVRFIATQVKPRGTTRPSDRAPSSTVAPAFAPQR
jgi:sigma-E factor negative regulatory protein RseB